MYTRDIFKTTKFYCVTVDLFHIVRESLSNLKSNGDQNTGIYKPRDAEQLNNHCVFIIIVIIVLIIINRPYTNKFKYILISFLTADT